MNNFKLTAASALLISFLSLLIVSCEKPLNRDENVFTKYGIPMTASQMVPTNGTAATGTLDVIYVRGEHTLSYTINYSGLSGNATGVLVYGPADPGYVSPSAALQTVTSGLPTGTSATYKGSLFVDNVLVKETDLLNNKFYIVVKTAAYPAGQIRAQVDFR